jgi:hypothetical protein
MSDKQQFILRAYPNQSREGAKAAIDSAPDGSLVSIRPAKRSDEQNSAQWPYLEGFAQQLQWPVNGVLTWLTKDEYKDILTCAFEGEINPRIASGYDGGVVMLGRRTSKFGINKFSLWLEWLVAAAALKGITPVYKHGRRDESY